MKSKITNEVKTGFLVLVCIFVLLGLVLKVGNFVVFKKGYTIRSQFHFTAGVKKNAPVRLSGVDVGEIKDIELKYENRTAIDLILWIKEGVKIQKNSVAYVTTLGLMGEKYVEIIPPPVLSAEGGPIAGQSQETGGGIKAGTSGAEYAQEGDVIASKDPVRLEELMEMATKVAGDIGKMANDISKVANNVDGVITENKPKLSRIFDNLEETSENFREFSDDVKWNPWKVLLKGKEKTRPEMEKERAQRLEERARAIRQNLGAQTAAPPAPAMTATAPAGSKNNFIFRKNK